MEKATPLGISLAKVSGATTIPLIGELARKRKKLQSKSHLSISGKKPHF